MTSVTPDLYNGPATVKDVKKMISRLYCGEVGCLQDLDITGHRHKLTPA